MALKGVSLAEQEPFVSPRDPGHQDHPEYKKAVADGTEPPKPTTFHIGNLTRAQRTRIGDLTTAPTLREGIGFVMSPRRVEKAMETVLYGLTGWDNFLGEDDVPIPFEMGSQPNGAGGFSSVVSDKAMQHLSQEDVLELADAILLKNGMTSELEKNFGGASRQPNGTALVAGDAPNAPMTKNESEVVLPEPNSEKV